MAEKILKLGIRKESGFLYFVNKQGYPARAKMARAGVRTSRGIEKLAKESVKKDSGYLYFIDKQGDIARAKMVHGGRKKAKVKKVKKRTVKRKAKSKRRRR